MAILGVRSGSAYAKLADATGNNGIVVKASTNTAEAPGTVPSNEVFEAAAGSALPVVRYSYTTFGTFAGVAPNAAQIDLFVDGSTTVVRTYTVSNPIATNEQVTFYATADGTATGAPRAGTYRLRVQASNIQSLPSDYRVNSDDTNTLLPTGDTNSTYQAFFRGGASLVFGWSDAALGGAAPTNNRFRFPESEFFRSTFGATIFSGMTTSNVTVSQRQGGVAKTTDTVAASGTTADLTRTGGVGSASGINNAFAAADTATAARVVLANSTLSGQPWAHLTSLPSGWAGTAGALGTGFVQADSPAALFQVDPRVTFVQLFQKNDNVFGTPPMSKNVASGQRLTSDLGYLAAEATDALGNGINGLAWTEKLWDSGNQISSEASPWKSRASTAQNQGGQAGWSDAFLTWDAQLPGGSWTQKEVVTTANATGLELSNTRTLTLLAANPNIKLIVSAGPASAAAESDHLHPGDPILVTLTLVRLDSDSQVVADASPAPSFVFLRYNSTLNQTEYLKADFTWAPANGATLNEFSLSPSAGDANTYVYTFTAAQSVNWGTFDLIGVVGKAFVGGTPYVDKAVRELVGSANSHTAWAFDAVGFATKGRISFK